MKLSRRKFLQTSAAAGAAAILGPRSWANAGSGAPANRPPNIILLIADDQRADSLSCAGNPILKTPSIDKLAQQGVLFRQSFSTTAICMCSRASLLTGLYTRCHEINSFGQPLKPEQFAATYPILLRQAGYRTGFIGKWGLGGPLPKTSYDYFAGFPGQGHYFAPGSKEHLTNIQAGQAEDFLHKQSADHPFCLAVCFKAPHVQDEGRKLPGIYAKYPYDRDLEPMYQKDVIPPTKTHDTAPMPPFFDKTLNRTREAPDFSPATYQETMKSLYRLLSGIDLAVGRITAAIQKLGVADNTVIIYTADHGSFYGEHGFGGKWLMLEESIRTPLIICDPRLPAAQKGTDRKTDMVLNIDFAPTVLDLAGIPKLPTMQGQSLLPLVRGERPAWRSEWFYEHSFEPNHIAKSEGIRNSQWKYVRYLDQTPPYEELFDLTADPREEKNLAADPAQSAILKAMQSRWQTWRTALDHSKTAATTWTDPT